MFALPALLAALADGFVLYLGVGGGAGGGGLGGGLSTSSTAAAADWSDFGTDDVGAGADEGLGNGTIKGEGEAASSATGGTAAASTTISHLLIFLAAIRLVLLLLPLSYHTYRGTRIRYQRLYYVYHVGCLMFVWGCMIWLSAVQQEQRQQLGGLDKANGIGIDGRNSSGSGGSSNMAATTASSILSGVWMMIKEGLDGFVREEVGDNDNRRIRMLLLSSADDDDGNDSTALAAATAKEDSAVAGTSTTTTTTQHLWILLSLSLLSITLHVVILIHVRSTAPTSQSIIDDGVKRRGKRRKMLAYYAYRRYYGNDTGIGDDDGDGDGLTLISASGVSAAEKEKQEEDEEEEKEEDGSPSKTKSQNGTKPPKKKNSGLVGGGYEYNSIGISTAAAAAGGDLLGEELQPLNHHPYGLDDDGGVTPSDDEEQGMVFRRTAAKEAAVSASSKNGPVIVTFPVGSATLPSRPTERISRGNSFGGQFDEFMSELNIRLDSAKRQWTARLEDFQRRVNSQINGSDEIDFTTGEQSQQSDLLSRGGGGFGGVRFLHLSPFRALLQLYAYEDVFTTGKLNRAFDEGDEDASEALVFYTPQLLSFLLHGAFLSSPQLESWILSRCKTNVHFAHRCFWFLRAWCLGHGSHSLDQQQRSCAVTSDSSGAEESLTTWRRGSESNLYLHSSNSARDLQDGSDATGSGSADFTRQSSKFPQEEHEVLERLLFKVIECGEAASISLQHGPLHRSFDDGETTSDMSPYQSSDEDMIEAGWVPRDLAGKPSLSHLNVLQPTRRCDFSPLELDDDGSHLADASTGDDKFLSTPKFLDALTSIADDLMMVEKSDRTTELRKRLRALECELLPSNLIYLPINNMKHRVWRIVADESVALSTNERVPCIILLEVLLCDDDENQGTMHRNRAPPVDAVARRLMQANGNIHNVIKSERDILNSWYKDPRPAQRHNTLRDNLLAFSKQLRHDIDDRIFDSDWRGMLSLPTYRDNDFEATSGVDTEQNDGEKEAMQDIATLDILDNRPPLAPAGSRSSSTLSLTAKGKTSTASSQPSSRASSRPTSPTSSIGQWHSPGLEKKKRAKLNIEDVQLRLQGESQVLQGLAMPSLTQDSATREYGLQRPFSDIDVSPPKTGNDQKKKRSRPPPVVFKEDWNAKQGRIRSMSAYGNDPRWRLLPILIKSNDDLRQEQLASQLIHSCASILARANVPAWLYPYEIIALTDRGGIIEAIPDTISISSLKSNDPNYVDLKTFFNSHFGPSGCDEHEQAKANFVESLAGYSMVCYLLQIKDRHNGNILLTNRGHLIHIDFGFFFLSSPGSNSGFESAPFKLTSDFIDLMDGIDSHTFDKFRELCYRTFIELRANCYKVILVVEMLMEGGEDLQCFCGKPERAVEELRQRFRLDLNDRACKKYVNSLIDESISNWRTDLYDRYQRVCVGVL